MASKFTGGCAQVAGCGGVWRMKKKKSAGEVREVVGKYMVCSERARMYFNCLPVCPILHSLLDSL